MQSADRHWPSWATGIFDVESSQCIPAHRLFVLPLAYMHNPVTLHTVSRLRLQLGFEALIGWKSLAVKITAIFGALGTVCIRCIMASSNMLP